MSDIVVVGFSCSKELRQEIKKQSRGNDSYFIREAIKQKLKEIKSEESK